MKKILVLFALFPLFCHIHAEGDDQVIINYIIENPGSQQGGGQRGPVTLPEVYQNGHVFTTGTSFLGRTFRLVNNGEVVFETIINSGDGGVVVIPEAITGNYELQIVDNPYIYYGFVLL